jgi:hypothetical protein
MRERRVQPLHGTQHELPHTPLDHLKFRLWAGSC